jgi:hypothetical protein
VCPPQQRTVWSGGISYPVSLDTWRYFKEAKDFQKRSVTIPVWTDSVIITVRASVIS